MPPAQKAATMGWDTNSKRGRSRGSLTGLDLGGSTTSGWGDWDVSVQGQGLRP